MPPDPLDSNMSATENVETSHQIPGATLILNHL